ncbi:MBG domain-containing protein, partial [Azospirillum sp. TSO22-1]|uniref:beta strand repeat-containing protein n=1 Tax=Azospirillum sp. TSO22-1 TaxID=716789 RepID=UPI000D61C9D4
LSNGNYVVRSSNWANGTAASAGAVTWGSGTAGVTGAVSAANSLVGTTANDAVGNGGVTALSNGHYVVASSNWDNGSTATNAGAVTWGNGTSGVTGVVSSSNSLVGTRTTDAVGGSVKVLGNGNYVVASSGWDNGSTATNAGAVTWGSGTAGVVGAVSASNSLVGTKANDNVGLGVTALSNGNYVVTSNNWDNGAATNAGAATWGSGTAGVTGVVSSSNSLVGTNGNDQVGDGVTALSNGNYVVTSTRWNNGTVVSAGAVTWGSGTSGVTGAVSAANSLVGTSFGNQVGDGVTALSNGNYVVTSTRWNNGTLTGAGAVTWGSGTSGVTGAVSAANSLVGTTTGAAVGGSVRELSNGNYVVASSKWANGSVASAGAVTWGNGTAGVTGVVSSSNSLVGTRLNDNIGSGGVAALSNGNYVVVSAKWSNGSVTNAGAVTWGSGTSGVSGAVSAANSLVGLTQNDNVGSGGVTALSNGHYVVASSQWSNGTLAGAGAATWGNGTAGITGAVSAANSLVGGKASANFSTVTELSGRFLVSSTADGTGGRVAVGLTDPSQLTFAAASAQTVTLAPAHLTATLNAGTAVALQASNDITVDSAITVDNPSGTGGALTLQAGRSILLNAGITTDNGNLTLIANETLANGVVDVQRDSGAAVVAMAAGTAIDAGTGTLSILLAPGTGKTHATSGAITLGTLTAGTVSVLNRGPTAGSDVILNGTVTASGSGANELVLATDAGAFTNNAGASALSAAASRFLVYAAKKTTSSTGGLTGGVIRYKTYDTYAPGSVTESGSQFLYADRPLTLTADSKSVTQGASPPTLTWTAGGLEGGDTIGAILSGTPLLTTTATAGSPAGSYTIAIAPGSVTTSGGYTVESLVPGTLTIAAPPVSPVSPPPPPVVTPVAPPPVVTPVTPPVEPTPPSPPPVVTPVTPPPVVTPVTPPPVVTPVVTPVAPPVVTPPLPPPPPVVPLPPAITGTTTGIGTPTVSLGTTTGPTFVPPPTVTGPNTVAATGTASSPSAGGTTSAVVVTAPAPSTPPSSAPGAGGSAAPQSAGIVTVQVTAPSAPSAGGVSAPVSAPTGQLETSVSAGGFNVVYSQPASYAASSAATGSNAPSTGNAPITTPGASPTAANRGDGANSAQSSTRGEGNGGTPLASASSFTTFKAEDNPSVAIVNPNGQSSTDQRHQETAQ